MNSLKDFFDRKNMGQTVLSILFAIYLIMGYETPDSLNEIIDSTYGKVVVVVLALVLFSFANPVLGVLGFFVAYMLILGHLYLPVLMQRNTIFLPKRKNIHP